MGFNTLSQARDLQPGDFTVVEEQRMVVNHVMTSGKTTMVELENKDTDRTAVLTAADDIWVLEH